MVARKHPLVSVLILNWNGEAFLEKCLLSVMETAYSPIEVVVVDNCSTDGSLEILSRFPSVKLVKNEDNFGYAKGNNVGFGHCSGSYIVTLNNDMTVDPGWLDEPVAVMEDDASIGVVGCRQMAYHEPLVIDGLYHLVKNDLTFEPFGARRALDENPRFMQSGYVLSVNGGSSVIRKKMIDELGGYDERYFAYYDEVDLCMKAFIHGWNAWYCPEAVVYHLGSASFKKTGVFTYFLRERNRLWFLYKYFPLRMVAAALPPLLWMEIRVFRVMACKLRKPFDYLRARSNAVRTLPAYRSARKENLMLLKKRMSLFCRLRRDGLLTATEFSEYRK